MTRRVSPAGAPARPTAIAVLARCACWNLGRAEAFAVAERLLIRLDLAVLPGPAAVREPVVVQVPVGSVSRLPIPRRCARSMGNVAAPVRSAAMVHSSSVTTASAACPRVNVLISTSRFGMLRSTRRFLLPLAFGLGWGPASGCQSTPTVDVHSADPEPTDENTRADEPTTGTDPSPGADGGPRPEPDTDELEVIDDQSSGPAPPDAGTRTCGGQTVEALAKRVNLVVVLDRSDSMTADWDGDNRWTVMRTALTSALNEVADRMYFGLQLFPSGDTDCRVEGDELSVALDRGHSSLVEIEDLLESTDLRAGTPTAEALELVLRYFTTGPGAELDGDSYVLLATDGGPNCNFDLSCEESERAEDQCTTNMDGDCSFPGAPPNCCLGAPDMCLDDRRSIDKVAELNAAGVPTFVVGIPGSEIYASVLAGLAEAGSASSDSTRYFEIEAADELVQTLTDITRELIRSCEFELEMHPPNRDEVNVYIDGEIVLQGEEGWDYASATATQTIVFQGDACANIELRGVERIGVEFGCPTRRHPVAR